MERGSAFALPRFVLLDRLLYRLFASGAGADLPGVVCWALRHFTPTTQAALPMSQMLAVILGGGAGTGLPLHQGRALVSALLAVQQSVAVHGSRFVVYSHDAAAR